MAHRAERIRRRNIRRLEEETKRAEQYSWTINSLYNNTILRAYVIIDSEVYSAVSKHLIENNYDLTYFYDQMIRENYEM